MSDRDLRVRTILEEEVRSDWLAEEVARRLFEVADLRRERDELRALLARLLDDPIERHINTHGNCRLCRARLWLNEEHAAECPVLRRDDLLGRTP